MAETIIRVKDQFYIHAESSLVDDRTRVLKHGESFAVLDRYGDIQPLEAFTHGLYHEGTRYLSHLELFLGGERPMFLSSSVREDNAALTVDLTNLDVKEDERIVLRRGTVHILRSRFLWDGVCYEQVRLVHYGLEPISVDLSFRFDADFADIFEVRGTTRAKRGERLPTAVTADTVTLGYEGLDRVVRRTQLRFEPAPERLTQSDALFTRRLEPKEEVTIALTVSCERNGCGQVSLSYDQACSHANQALRDSMAMDCEVETTDWQFNNWLQRSRTDLHMMVTQTPQGSYPYAGVPWFSTPFGRDGIITAMEYLWVNPAIAQGVLDYLAVTQAKEVDPARDAEPGKILHESRLGEMAALGEIPFGRYYGSVDSTPLFIMLAGAYYERTSDVELLHRIWPNLELALAWLDRYGDADGDGFVEYARQSKNGLVHQGWKDSHDSVFHMDGRMVEPPIALCEVQGYVYAAKKSAALCAEVLGKSAVAERLRAEARKVQQRFEASFWLESLSNYALALDGAKRPCVVQSSNAGHCLFAGIADEARARRVADTLLSPAMFSGWGVRTLGDREVRYSPMSYHNGSIWPHDNAVIAMGMSRYGMTDAAVTIMKALFDASLYMDQNRLPELFCGFTRREGEGPSLYPVACSPQAWSAGSAYLLVAAALGLSIDAAARRVTFRRPQLPDFLEEMSMRNLRVGDATVDLRVSKGRVGLSIETVRQDGRVDVVVTK
ncbi:MAG: amylo-alpha-1,6-glucosidase [Nitrospiraceae bacterium]